jgi:hypothetical protein
LYNNQYNVKSDTYRRGGLSDAGIDLHPERVDFDRMGWKAPRPTAEAR